MNVSHISRPKSSVSLLRLPMLRFISTREVLLRSLGSPRLCVEQLRMTIPSHCVFCASIEYIGSETVDLNSTRIEEPVGKKISLKMDELAVESFATAGGPVPLRGTVHGRESRFGDC